ncbi:MAG: chemotaxis protein CheR [Gammaproteobacteria bacterium]|nr:chemotaxis protein CheR [Gammaproteobacteria bacterium]
MKNEQCIRFLQWALPQLNLRWSGYRKVHNQVCKRIDRRLRDLGLNGIDDYQAYVEQHSDEWVQLDSFCRITISRFYRDKSVFAVLEEVLSSLAHRAGKRGDSTLRIWSAGCGSGEEPYTLAILTDLRLQSHFPGLTIEIVATDADPIMIRRAHEGCYQFGSVKNLPESWRDRAFTQTGDAYCIKPEYKLKVEFLEQDVRSEQPRGPFDLVLCRNLAFTYFDDALQLDMLRHIVDRMHDGAALVIGVHENLPDVAEGLLTWFDKQRIYQKVANM